MLTFVLKQQGGIENCIIDDIGEFFGMEANNTDFEEYRKNNPGWNQLPYDLEFNMGCMVADEINEITGLYPNLQKYFDVYNNFCCHMIPSCENNPIALDDDFLKSILTDSGESVDYDIENIRNVTEVLGSVYEIDRMSENCTTSGNMSYNIKRLITPAVFIIWANTSPMPYAFLPPMRRTRSIRSSILQNGLTAKTWYSAWNPTIPLRYSR